MFKRMKRLLRLRNKGGFTLVEVVIACALLGILVLGIMGFITPILSSVRSKEQNARAVMLSEAIDSYIAESIQYAFYVQTITEAASTDTISTGGAEPAVLSMKYNGAEFEKQQDKGLADLLNCLNNNLAGEVFEIRCIGVRWLEEPGGNGEKKLMITNEKVDQSNCSLDPDESKLVFEPVFYDDLYPVIRFENYSNQYQLKDEDGNPQDQVPEDKVDIAPGLKIVTDVYLTPDCYNVNDDVRNDAMLTFSGNIRTDFTNIKSNLINSGVYKIQPAISAHTQLNADGKTVPSYSAAREADVPASEYHGDDGKVYYHPNSFIYYIARKTKTGSDPATPAPTPEST